MIKYLKKIFDKNSKKRLAFYAVENLDNSIMCNILFIYFITEIKMKNNKYNLKLTPILAEKQDKNIDIIDMNYIEFSYTKEEIREILINVNKAIDSEIPIINILNFFINSEKMCVIIDDIVNNIDKHTKKNRSSNNLVNKITNNIKNSVIIPKGESLKFAVYNERTHNFLNIKLIEPNIVKKEVDRYVMFFSILNIEKSFLYDNIINSEEEVMISLLTEDNKICKVIGYFNSLGILIEKNDTENAMYVLNINSILIKKKISNIYAENLNSFNKKYDDMIINTKNRENKISKTKIKSLVEFDGLLDEKDDKENNKEKNNIIVDLNSIF